MDRKNGQRNGGNEITATLPRSAVTAIGANGRRRSNYKLPSIGRSVLRDRRFAFPVSRFPFSVSEQSVCSWIRWTIFEERGTRWLTSRVRSSVTLSSTVFTRR